MTGKAGVGVLANTLGMPFMTLRYWRTRLSIEVLAGWAGDYASEATAQDSTSRLRLGLGTLYRIADHPKASFSVGVRPWLQIDYVTLSDAAAESDTDTSLSWGLELPLQAEAFLTDHVSIQGMVGFSFGLNAPPGGGTDALSQRARDDSVLFGLGGSGFGGGIGLTYYF